VQRTRVNTEAVVHHENTHTEPRHPKKRIHVKRKKRTQPERPEHVQPVEGAREPDEILPPEGDDFELDHDLDGAPVHTDIDDRVR
jgi:hypothetical protein